MTDDLLNVSTVRPRTRANGPGWRAAVWVQGCSIRCPGCFNPQTHIHDVRRLWNPEVLAGRMISPEVEGISILGGEPFEQAAACARLARQARRLGGSVVTYSGYTWRYLEKSGLPEVQELLAATDLLIAGPFVAALANDGRGWHGSQNQEFVFLTGRYDEGVRAQFDEAPVVEVWTDGLRADWTGIPGMPPLDQVG
jgi:anaerobic ribonucleoside-triphosphate reductase activating protein